MSPRRLLTCGIAAGPLYLALGFLQIAIRPGFDVRRHPLSLMSNGDLGWIQIASFIITGLLLIAGAMGLKQTITSGRGSTWAPRMLTLYGLGLIGAGIFRADPALGFPPGTPEANNAISWHGFVHFGVGTVGFIGFISVCIILGRRFAAAGQRGWSIVSWVTGIFFLGAFVGIASGSKGPMSLWFLAAVTAGFIWLSLALAEIRAGRV